MYIIIELILSKQLKSILKVMIYNYHKKNFYTCIDDWNFNRMNILLKLE